MANIVNKMDLRNQRGFKAEIARVLEQTLSSVPWFAPQKPSARRTADPDADFVIELRAQHGHKTRLVVACKEELKPSLLPGVLTRLRNAAQVERGVKPVLVVAARHVSCRTAELCAELGLSWIDMAGNCRITGPGIYIERTGNLPVVKRPRPGTDLSSWAAARVLRVLLAPECAGRRWTQRELELETQNPSQPMWPTPPASLGLVNKVVRHLRDEAFLTSRPEGGFIVSDPLRLLEAWRDVYRYRDHVREGHFTLLQGTKLVAALSKLRTVSEFPLALASFSAADLQAPAVRHARTWLYVHPARVPEVQAVLEAKPVDSGENIVLLTPADDGVYYRLDEKSGRLSCTNLVQTYLDLRHGAGRGEEAAEAILEQRLKPAWNAGRVL